MRGLRSGATAPPQGQTAPGPAHSIPINGTEVRYTHFSAERQQLIFFPLSLSPSLYPSILPPMIVEQLTAEAQLFT